MIVAFKSIGKREREALDALGVRVQNGTDGRPVGSVVTINGCVVLAFGRHDAVIYQDGSRAVPDLIRAHKRVWSATGDLNYEDRERIRRKGKPPRTVEDIMAGRA